MSKFSPDYFVFAETKLDESFPTAQFEIEGYEIRTRKDRDKHGGGLIEYVRKGIICKQINNFGVCNSEIIFSELTIRNKKWVIVSVYRPPSHTNLAEFFAELEKILSNAFSNCDNIIIMGDINIDFYNQIGNGYNQLHSFCDIFNLKNLIKSKTCFAGAEVSSIDVLLTNKYRSFQNSSVLETGLSDHHLMITTFF